MLATNNSNVEQICTSPKIRLQYPFCWLQNFLQPAVDASWNVMSHAQKPDFVFRAKRTCPFKSAGGWRQFSRLLAAEVCSSAVVMLDTPCSEVVWRVLATHCIRQFPLHFPSRASPCAITFQLESNAGYTMFRGSVKSTGYPLHSPVSPFTSPPVRHRVTSHFNWSLRQVNVPATSVSVWRVNPIVLPETFKMLSLGTLLCYFKHLSFQN